LTDFGHDNRWKPWFASGIETTFRVIDRAGGLMMVEPASILLARRFPSVARRNGVDHTRIFRPTDSNSHRQRRTTSRVLTRAPSHYHPTLRTFAELPPLPELKAAHIMDSLEPKYWLRRAISGEFP
jgi:hypothetical protein